MAEETLTDKEKRSYYDSRWPSIRKKWQAYREAEDLRKRHHEETVRKKQEEIERREREAIRKAQEDQQRAAKERLRKSLEEERRKAKVEADRIKAEEEQQRRRADEDRRSRFEQEAIMRTEAVLDIRRMQQKEQAERRMKQQSTHDQLQQRSDIWSQFRQRRQHTLSSSMQTQQSMGSDPVCKHNFWIKKKGMIKCSACNSTKFLECADCLQAHCLRCKEQRL